MGRSALVVLLVASQALAEPPRMERVAPGYVVTSPAWLLNEPGKAKLDATLERHFAELTTLRAENTSLKSGLGDMEKKPALTWKGALLLVGLGVVVGAAVAVPAALAVRR